MLDGNFPNLLMNWFHAGFVHGNVSQKNCGDEWFNRRNWDIGQWWWRGLARWVLPTGSLHMYQLLTKSVENSLPCQNLENKVLFCVAKGRVSSIQRNSLFIHCFIEIWLAWRQHPYKEGSHVINEKKAERSPLEHPQLLHHQSFHNCTALVWSKVEK